MGIFGTVTNGLKGIAGASSNIVGGGPISSLVGTLSGLGKDPQQEEGRALAQELEGNVTRLQGTPGNAAYYLDRRTGNIYVARSYGGYDPDPIIDSWAQSYRDNFFAARSLGEKALGLAAREGFLNPPSKSTGQTVLAGMGKKISPLFLLLAVGVALAFVKK